MKHILGTAAVAASIAFATPAYAAITIGRSDAQGQTTQFGSAQTGNSVTATTNQTNTQVTFTSANTLISNSGGQASVTGPVTGPTGGSPSDFANSLTGIVTFTIQNGFSFNYAEFNLPGIAGQAPPAEASSVLIEALLNGVAVESASFGLDGNGLNSFNVSGGTYTGVRITLSPQGAGVGSLEQLRLTAQPIQAPIPEPGTWALMLVGFGGMGVAMRRSRRKNVRLLQAA